MKLSDPIYKPLREFYGVEDKEKFMQEANFRVKDRRPRHCVTCGGKEYEYRICDVKGIDCNCCLLEKCSCPFATK